MNNLASCLFVAIILLWAQPVLAYIDPGSGSAIVSAIIGFFVAIGLAIKTYWYKIKSILNFSKKNTEENQDS